MRRLTIFAALLVAALMVSLPAPAQDVITTLIGGGPNGIPALDANLYYPAGVAVDTAGNFYIAAYGQNRVFKVSTAGTITVVAGTGAQGYAGDGGVATLANLYHPYAVAVDSASPANVYIADENNCVVRKVTASTGIITTIAGDGTCGYLGDGAKATLGELYYPAGVAVDSLGNLYIGDQYNCRIRKVILASGIISTSAGNGTCGYTGNSGAAIAGEVNYPTGVAVDSAGDVFIADSNNYVIREVTKANGKINTVAGDNVYGFSGDGAAATAAEMGRPYAVATNGAGTVVTVADTNNQRIRQFTVGGNITTVAGNGTACGSGTCGEGGTATSAELYNPQGVAVTSGGKVYIGNYNYYVVDSFTVGGNLNVAAGNHSYNIETLLTGQPANGVELNNPFELAVDTAGDVFVADSANFMVRKYVKSSGLVNFFAGDGTNGYSGDGGAATSAELSSTYGVATSGAGATVYVGDTSGCAVRDVAAADINLFAGVVVGGTSPRCGYTGDGGPATSSELYYPYGVAVDSKGSVYIADEQENVVRKVTAGTINTIAGIGGLTGYSGDGGPAANALLYNPEAVAVDPAGNVFIADTSNSRVREINAATGIITTIAGTGSSTFSGDGLATSNSVYAPQGIAVDKNDNVFVSDYTDRVRWISPNGYMTTIAGTGANGYNGDGILATTASLAEPTGIALDAAGDILVSDYNNARVRSISVFPALSTSAGSLAFGLTSVGSTSSPETLILSAYGPVTISNIQTSPGFSEADDCPASLPNGTTCTMYVYFVPTGSGTSNGTVTVVTNGFFSQTNTVNLSGLGSAISLAGAPVLFGNQVVKTTSANKVVTVANQGTTAITMGAITLTDTTDFKIVTNTCPASGASLAGKASCAITVNFTPASTGAKRGSVVVNDSDPSSPQLIGLTGTGTSNVVLNPTSVTFATTAVGVPSAATKITLTNSTGANVTLSNPAVSVTASFVIAAATTTCTPDLVIAASGTCSIYVEFKPTKVGYASGTLSVSDGNATSPQTVALQGYGTGVKFTPGTLIFGTVTDGSQVNSTATITNVGTTPVFFTGAELSGANSADFSVNYGDSAPCNNTSANPLKPGATCQITVYFDPTKVGAEKATYKLYDNSIGSPQILTLTGTGQN
jgi:sugar lactone lactonase YvrE